MTNSLVRTEKQRGVAHVILDRPAKRNALNAEMLTELVSTLRDCQADPSVRAIVISGSERGFAAGADIGTLASANPIELYTSGFSEKWDEVAAISKPLIAAISSYALGGGLELALICDIVVADETALFGMPEATIGIIPGAGGTQRLVRAIGKSMAMEMILAGRRLDAREAKACGLISSIAADGRPIADHALEIAERIAQAAPLAVTMAKAAILESFEAPLSAGIRFERSLSALITASDDRAEGMRAFAAKEPPLFTGQ
ncbi:MULTISPECIES: enoyl-CoA hydratase-related protein [unclassified Rhizobium]|jgi:enoyl-CoA hydratase|uniref:enoyl-CoA hydratase-related protein n=1 Tax=unclassified Rhizobium TaxID=2613769 RepID=UPI00064550AD|nr:MULTISPECIES: enoyl-CoA hydratase-related protein [unclassified Rhizobium]MBN8954439.1 enoyl-CoA hydratase/isomerase family protein [Rhizobium tropici]OJY77639.1 MAG: enoyl-CoA hydratase [Rhizobium sp. 60-20]RKD56203.1 enoyl-CoA hydratase [Rhizobium sp. WW_1]